MATKKVFVTFNREITVNGVEVWGLGASEDDVSIKEGIAVSLHCGDTLVVLPWHSIEAIQMEDHQGIEDKLCCELCGNPEAECSPHTDPELGEVMACADCVACSAWCEMCEDADATTKVEYLGHQLRVCHICKEQAPRAEGM